MGAHRKLKSCSLTAREPEPPDLAQVPVTIGPHVARHLGRGARFDSSEHERSAFGVLRGYRADFTRLQRRCASTVFERVWSPPRDNGVT